VQRDGHLDGQAQRAEARLQLQETELELLRHGVRFLANRSMLAGTKRPEALSQWRFNVGWTASGPRSCYSLCNSVVYNFNIIPIDLSRFKSERGRTLVCIYIRCCFVRRCHL
jgi:hypothetical protein